VIKTPSAAYCAVFAIFSNSRVRPIRVNVETDVYVIVFGNRESAQGICDFRFYWLIPIEINDTHDGYSCQGLENVNRHRDCAIVAFFHKLLRDGDMRHQSLVIHTLKRSE
jgi:hypothetical protein